MSSFICWHAAFSSTDLGPVVSVVCHPSPLDFGMRMGREDRVGWLIPTHQLHCSIRAAYSDSSSLSRKFRQKGEKGAVIKDSQVGPPCTLLDAFQPPQPPSPDPPSPHTYICTPTHTLALIPPPCNPVRNKQIGLFS